jgi:hypothetical protein
MRRWKLAVAERAHDGAIDEIAGTPVVLGRDPRIGAFATHDRDRGGDGAVDREDAAPHG